MAIILGVALVVTMPAAYEAAAQSENQDEVLINGFRSVRFDMNEKDLRAAIRKDFKSVGRKVEVEKDPVYKTTTLVINVKDVIPDSGPVEINYVLGYKTRKLIQVNLFWSTRDGDLSPKQIGDTGQLLRDYFLGRNFDPEKVTLNGQLATGANIVFRGFDKEDHMVLLLFNRVTLPPDVGTDTDKKDDEPQVVASLRLSYVVDVKDPDIFRLKEGSF